MKARRPRRPKQELVAREDTAEEIPLTEHQEAFCRNYVEYRNASTAYERSYTVGANTKPVTVYQNAVRLLRHPGVAMRIEQLRDELESQVMYRARELFGDLLDIAAADPNKIVAHTKVNCRHCRGVDHQYQWREIEWATAAADALAKEMQAPSDAGGFGFDPQLPPVETCPTCYGEGTRVVRVANTNELDNRTLKLYKGVKYKADGSIEILMHDQADARKELAKIMGIYRDGRGGGGIDLTPPPAQIVDGAAPEEATQTYLEMIG